MPSRAFEYGVETALGTQITLKSMRPLAPAACYARDSSYYQFSRLYRGATPINIYTCIFYALLRGRLFACHQPLPPYLLTDVACNKYEAQIESTTSKKGENESHPIHNGFLDLVKP